MASNKQVVRLTEDDLRKIISESVNKVINEISYGLVKKTYDKMRDLGQDNRADDFEDSFCQVYNYKDDDGNFISHNLGNDAMSFGNSKNGDMRSIYRDSSRFEVPFGYDAIDKDYKFSRTTRDKLHVTDSPKMAKKFSDAVNNFANGELKFTKNDFRK